MAFIKDDLTAIIGEERFIPAHIITAVYNDSTTVGRAGDPLCIADRTFTLQNKFLPVCNEQGICD